MPGKINAETATFILGLFLGVCFGLLIIWLGLYIHELKSDARYGNCLLRIAEEKCPTDISSLDVWENPHYACLYGEQVIFPLDQINECWESSGSIVRVIRDVY